MSYVRTSWAFNLHCAFEIVAFLRVVVRYRYDLDQLLQHCDVGKTTTTFFTIMRTSVNSAVIVNHVMFNYLTASMLCEQLSNVITYNTSEKLAVVVRSRSMHGWQQRSSLMVHDVFFNNWLCNTCGRVHFWILDKKMLCYKSNSRITVTASLITRCLSKQRDVAIWMFTLYNFHINVSSS